MCLSVPPEDEDTFIGIMQNDAILWSDEGLIRAVAASGMSLLLLLT